MKSFYLNLFDSVGTYLRGLEVDLTPFKEDADFEKEMNRIIGYKKYFRAYNNSIDSKWSPNEGADAERVKVNICKALVDRSVDFLISKPFTPYPPEKSAKLMTPVLEYINTQAGMDLFAMEVVTNASICGDSFVKIIWDEALGCSRFQLLDSEKTFVKYRNTERNRTVLDKAVIIWEGGYDVYGNGDYMPVLFKEMWTENTRILACEYVVPKEDADSWSGKLMAQLLPAEAGHPKNIEIKEIIIEEMANDLGFIPVVHFRNQISPLEIYGRSDLIDVVSLNSSINDAATQYLDSVKYHGSPVTLMYGAKIGNIKRGPNKIWSGLPKDAKIDQLGGTQNFDAIKSFIDLMQDYIFVSAGIPEISTGLFQNVSNATGVALQVQYLPLIGLTRRKRLSYGPAFEQMYEYGLKLLDRNKQLFLQERVDKYVSLLNDLNHQQASDRIQQASETPEIEDDYEAILDALVLDLETTLQYSPFWKVEIKWADYLPKDSKQELDEIKSEMEAGLESRRGALRRRGVEDIEAKLREIDEDQASSINYMAAYTPENASDYFAGDEEAENFNEDGEEIPREVTEDASELQKDSQRI